jgi:hypothetical protein
MTLAGGETWMKANEAMNAASASTSRMLAWVNPAAPELS